MVRFVFSTLGKTTVLLMRLGLILPLAYVRKRSAQRYFAAELEAMGIPDDVVSVMAGHYREMLHLNPLAYVGSFQHAAKQRKHHPVIQVPDQVES